VSTRRGRGASVARHSVLSIGALTVLFPAYILVSGAIRPAGELAPNRLVPSPDPTLANFATAWTSADLGSAILTSAFITLVSVVLIVAIASAAAYPLARLTAGWSRIAYVLFMVGFLVPFQLALLPLYSTFRDLGLLGNPLGLVIVYTGLQMPFAVYLYTEFIRSVPREYDEAAEVDGCTPLGLFFRIIFPLVRPITGTVVVLNIVAIWNDFYSPLLFLSGSGFRTLPLAVYQFMGQYTNQWELLFASLLLGAVPVLVAFLIMQRAVFRGYASGLKG
jgi:raffinose/stachyose/melibiose transport system permease protein